MGFYDYFVLFAFSVLMFQICSKIAIELYEKNENTDSPIYHVMLLGIFSFIYSGTESLYRMVKIKEKEAYHGRKS